MPQADGACNVHINGNDDYHERCYCDSTPIEDCKIMCDADENCKGYGKRKTSCQIATTSSCESRCFKDNEGNTGSLVVDSAEFADLDYEGCFIKLGNF